MWLQTYRLRPHSTQSSISDKQTDRSKVGGNNADIQNEVQTEISKGINREYMFHLEHIQSEG